MAPLNTLRTWLQSSFTRSANTDSAHYQPLLQGEDSQAELPLHYDPDEKQVADRSRRKWVLVTVPLAGALGLLYVYGQSRAPARNPAYLIEAEHGTVATENLHCSETGVKIMQQGGNAVDAAVASTLCIGITNMFSSGIGGGGFLTVRVPTSPSNSSAHSSEVWTIDFRETAPAAANKTMFSENPMASRFGGLSVGVPGEVRGLAEMHQRWGRLDWKDVVLPTVDIAAGFPVGKELGIRMQWPFFADLLLKNPDWTPIFAPNGRLLREGEIMRRTNLSRTLAAIAEEGPDAFYQGSIADALVDKIQATGGVLTQADFANYSVITRPALEGVYRGRKVYTSHEPTSGPALLHMLNLADYYEFREEGRTGLNAHRQVEMMKFGFAARTKICDPAFNDNATRIQELTTEQFAHEIVANITDDRTHPPEYYNPVFDVPTDHGTTHVSVVDSDGMAVSLTSTVNLIFGSQVLDPVTGIILNDEMDDFSTPGVPNAFGLLPSPYNYPEPFKRPLSSTAPTILENADGSFHLALGGSGGSRIFPAVFQVITNVDDWDQDISAAIEYGRMHDQLYPLFMDADDVLPSALIDGLRERGHNVTVSPVNRVAAVVQGVMAKDGKFYGASDSRKNGIAAGY